MRSLVCFVMLFVGQAGAQEKQPTPHVVSPAEKKFEELVHKGDEHLARIAPYEVTIESAHSIDGREPSKHGKNRFHLIVDKGRTRFRIEAKIADASTPTLVVVSDGKVVRHSYATKKLYSEREAEKPLDELFADAMTAHALEGTGIEFLLREDVRHNVLARTVRFEDRGEAKLDGKATHHFQVDFINRKKIDLWFSNDANLLQRMTTTQVISLGEKKSFTSVTTANYRWNHAPTNAEESFKLADTDLKRVTSIFDALAKGDPTELIGKQAPTLKLRGLDGKDTSLNDHKGKQPLVLYLWATWAATSAADRPAIAELVNGYREKGVLFLSINVGEKEDRVRAFLEKTGRKSTVLIDPNATILDAYHLSSLSAAIVIGRDGTVRDILSGSGAPYREKLSRALESVLKAP